MTRFLAFVFLVTLGCVTANVPNSISDAIPQDAKVVRLYSQETAAVYNATLYRALAADGFRIAQSDQGMGTIATEFKDIGQGTTLRLSLLLSPSVGGCMAVMRGEWGITASMAAGFSGGFGFSVAGGSPESVDWGRDGRPRAAFGEMAVIANRLPHSRIEYAER